MALFAAARFVNSNGYRELSPFTGTLSQWFVVSAIICRCMYGIGIGLSCCMMKSHLHCLGSVDAVVIVIAHGVCFMPVCD